MPQLDMNSQTFKDELEKTEKFTSKICERKGWVYGPIDDVNEGVIMGLTRLKILYGKRFCSCFMVEPDPVKEGKYKSTDDRVCPCKPAIEKEIPEQGICHCQIFCTPEYKAEQLGKA